MQLVKQTVIQSLDSGISHHHIAPVLHAAHMAVQLLGAFVPCIVLPQSILRHPQVGGFSHSISRAGKTGLCVCCDLLDLFWRDEFICRVVTEIVGRADDKIGAGHGGYILLHAEAAHKGTQRIEQCHRQCQRHHHQHRLFLVSSQIGKGHLMELRSPDAAPFFLGLHHIRIFGSLHRRDLGCHFSGLGTGQKHRQQGKQHGPKEDHRRSADGGDACIQLDGVQDNRHQNSADAVAQQQPRRNTDQTKQKCLLANDAFELPGRCANGFQKSVKPDIPYNRDLENVIDDKIPRENHQQQKSCYGDHKFRIKLRLQLG